MSAKSNGQWFDRPASQLQDLFCRMAVFLCGEVEESVRNWPTDVQVILLQTCFQELDFHKAMLL